jgi:hypothetical protein
MLEELRKQEYAETRASYIWKTPSRKATLVLGSVGRPAAVLTQSVVVLASFGRFAKNRGLAERAEHPADFCIPSSNEKS